MARDGDTIARAKTLRAGQSPVEARFWHALRGHCFEGIKFARQIAIGPFIIDFGARSRKLLIEIDGDTHAERLDYDAARTAFLESKGYRVIRFTNADVMRNLPGVLEGISAALATPPLPASGEREQKR